MWDYENLRKNSVFWESQSKMWDFWASHTEKSEILRNFLKCALKPRFTMKILLLFVIRFIQVDKMFLSWQLEIEKGCFFWVSVAPLSTLSSILFSLARNSFSSPAFHSFFTRRRRWKEIALDWRAFLSRLSGFFN